MSRDWTKTLWPASYKGAPFWVENDSLPDGRRLVVHEFPNRDEPFVEDMGRKAGTIEVTAYVASDLADVEAQALRGLAALKGAGPLVLPVWGVLDAHLQDVKPAHDKSKLGYVALTMTFVRAGADAPLVTVESLAQLVFDAAEGAVVTFAEGFVAAIVAGVAAPLAREAVVARMLDIPAALEDARAAAALDPVASLATHGDLQDLFAAAPTALDDRAARGAWLAAAGEAARALGDALSEPDEAERLFADAASAFAEPVVPAGGVASPATQIAAAAAQVDRFARAICLPPRAEALMRRRFGDRRAASTARAAFLGEMELELAAASVARDETGWAALRDLRAAVCAWFDATILDLKPVILATAPRSLPAVWWAWRLYADPGRAQELVDRNRAPHPSFLPATIEAVAA